jgi:hypothetical protein
MRTQDRLGLLAVEGATSKEVGSIVGALPQFHSATAVKSEGRVYIADEDYSVYDVRSYRGASLSTLPEGAPGSAGVGSTDGTNGRRSGLARLVGTG